MAKLTKTLVEAAAPSDKPYFIWCSSLPGFGVRIFPTGKRIYYCDYRNDIGARKRISIATHGKVTTEEARKLAVRTLGDVEHGEDPAEERATQRSSLTVTQLCDNYLAACDKGLIMGRKRTPKKASTLATDRGRIERHIKVLLGDKLVRDLTSADIVKFIDDLTEGEGVKTKVKTGKRGLAIVEGGAGTAARTAGLLGAILTYAVSRGIIPMNPAAGVKKPASVAKTRRLSPDEYRAFGKELEASEDLPSQIVAGCWLLAFSGCRLQEIARLTWPEVDETGSCLRLGDTKTGASVRAAGRPVFEVLATLPRKEGSEYVLPAVRGDGYLVSLNKAVARIAAKAGLKEVTTHTLRHSFGSAAGDLGFSDGVIGDLLGHARLSVTSKYIHRLDSTIIAAADKVARSIQAMMTGQKSKVVDFPKRKSAK